jgi:hypothetical protein
MESSEVGLSGQQRDESVESSCARRVSNDIVCNINTKERWKWVVMDNKLCSEILAS